MTDIAPPELKLRLGKQVTCDEGHPWMYIGTIQTTVSHQLAFLRLDTIHLPRPYIYNATHKSTLIAKFPELLELDPEYIKRKGEEECPACKIGSLYSAKWSGVDCRNPKCNYTFCF